MEPLAAHGVHRRPSFSCTDLSAVTKKLPSLVPGVLTKDKRSGPKESFWNPKQATALDKESRQNFNVIDRK